MDEQATEHRNTEQIRRAASVQSGLPASKEAMKEPPPPKQSGDIVGPVPPNAQDEPRFVERQENAPDWPPDYLKR